MVKSATLNDNEHDFDDSEWFNARMLDLTVQA